MNTPSRMYDKKGGRRDDPYHLGLGTSIIHHLYKRACDSKNCTCDLCGCVSMHVVIVDRDIHTPLSEGIPPLPIVSLWTIPQWRSVHI